MEDAEVIADLFLVCRLCIVEKGAFAILAPTQKQIAEIFNVTIDTYDGLSQLLCNGCRNKLLEIQALRKSYIENQQILTQLKESYFNNQPNDFGINNTDINNAFKKNCNKSRAVARKKTSSGYTGRNAISEVLKRKHYDEESSNYKSQKTLNKIKSGINVASNITSNVAHDTSLAAPSNIDIKIEANTTQNKDVPNMSANVCNDNVEVKTETKTSSISDSDLSDLERDIMELIENEDVFNDMNNVELSKNYIENISPDLTSEYNLRDYIYLPVKFNTMLQGVDECQFYCRMCNNQYDRFEDLTSHFKSHINVIKIYRDLIPKLLLVKLTHSDNCTNPPKYYYHNNPFYYCKFSKRTKIPRNAVTESNSNQVNNELSTNSIPTLPDINSDMSAVFMASIPSTKPSELNIKPEPDNIAHNIVENIHDDGNITSPIESISSFECTQHLEVKPNPELIENIIYQRLDKYNRTKTEPQELHQVNKILKICLKFNMKVRFNEHKTDCPELLLKTVVTDNKCTKTLNMIGFVRCCEVESTTSSSNNQKSVRSSMPQIVKITSVPDTRQEVPIDIDKDKVTSDGSISPFKFVQSLLDNQNIILTEESTGEIPIVCYKVKVGLNRNLTVSVYCQENVFFIEISEDFNNLDLTKETPVAQWDVINSMKQQNIQRLMINSSKRVNSFQTSVVQKYCRIINSVLGTVNNDCVSLEAPTTFYF